MNIRSTSKLGLLVAVGFVALGAMSAPAFSESTEFRRGYEEGFRDAMNGKRPQHGQYQGRNGRIDIGTAIYGAQGRRGQTCNAEPALQKAINRADNNGNNRWDSDRNRSPRNFSIVASDRLCGDPSPHRAKSLVVTYRCGNSDLMRVQAAEGNTLRMRC